MPQPVTMGKNDETSDCNKRKNIVKIVRGFPFPNNPPYEEEMIEDALDEMPHDGDVVLHSYPKTGTYWISYIIWLILHQGEHYPVGPLIKLNVPIREMVGLECLKKVKGTRFYKSHLPFNMVRKNENAKYIYIHRNPFDMYLSMFHFTNELFGVSLTWDDFLELLRTRGLYYGDYFDHVLSFYACRNDPNVLLVSYEDLQTERRREVLRIAKFLGKEYYDSLSHDGEVLQKIVQITEFDYMRKHLIMDLSLDGGGGKINFFRKGVTGDGKRSLPKYVFEEIRRIMLSKMRGTEFVQLWNPDESHNKENHNKIH